MNKVCSRGHRIEGENAQRQGERIRCRTCARVNARRSQARKAGRREPEHGEPPSYSTRPLEGVNAVGAPISPPEGPSARAQVQELVDPVEHRVDVQGLLREAKAAFLEDPQYLIDMLADGHRVRQGKGLR